MVHLHNGILHSREKEGAYTLCNGMDRTGMDFYNMSLCIQVLSQLGGPALCVSHQQVAVWFEVCTQEQGGRELLGVWVSSWVGTG